MEAGLFPGLVYYLTFWYRNSERSMRVALILASATLAGAFGGAIAYGVGHMNQAHGLSVDGDHPAGDAVLQNEGSKGAAHAMTWADAKEILTDWRLYAHYIVRLSFVY